MSSMTPLPVPPPSRTRLAFAALIGAYPLIVAIQAAIQPFTADWPIWARSLLVTPLMVAGMVFVIIPFIHRRLSGWIRPTAPGRGAGRAPGTARPQSR